MEKYYQVDYMCLYLISQHEPWKQGELEVFQLLIENNFYPRKTHPAKLSFEIDGEIMPFYDKEHFNKFMTTKPALQKFLKDILKRNNQTNIAQKSNKITIPNRQDADQKGEKWINERKIMQQ